VFVFFGLVATAGSAYVQQEHLHALPIAAGVPIGFLSTALLVVNNLRDIPGDTVAGKRTLAVRIGDRRTRVLYVALLVGAFLLVPIIAGGMGRPAGALALIAIVVAQKPVLQVLQGATGPALIPVLVATGRAQLVFGVLFALGIWISGSR
jgi:1,4-dihydroxy-2-naphthoate octaprenyltransferase